MKKTKQPQSSKLTEADKALLKEVALNLSKEHILFKRKVASAKAYLKLANLSSKKTAQ
jgi:hypothetical protein